MKSQVLGPGAQRRDKAQIGTKQPVRQRDGGQRVWSTQDTAIMLHASNVKTSRNFDNVCVDSADAGPYAVADCPRHGLIDSRVLHESQSAWRATTDPDNNKASRISYLFYQVERAIDCGVFALASFAAGARNFAAVSPVHVVRILLLHQISLDVIDEERRDSAALAVHQLGASIQSPGRDAVDLFHTPAEPILRFHNAYIVAAVTLQLFRGR